MNAKDFVVYFPSESFLNVKTLPNQGQSADDWAHRAATDLMCLLDLDKKANVGAQHRLIKETLEKAMLVGKFRMARTDGSDVAAWAWRSEGMTGWALGHLQPTPQNCHKFYTRRTEVRPLMFLPSPADELKMPWMVISCLVCGKEGTYRDVGNPPHGTGWRLASNRPGGYTCCPEHDAVIEAFDEAKKAEAKAAKAAKKEKSRDHSSKQAEDGQRK